MKPIFRINLESILNGPDPIYLELGSGKRKSKNRINIDCLDFPSVDIIADLEEGLPFFPDNSIDGIFSKSFLEHISNFERIMYEIWRVLKSDGKKKLFVPHFSNPYYYSDFTHKRFFGLYSFEYFSKNQTRFRRKVPNFYYDFQFNTLELILHFNSSFKILKPFNAIQYKIFNISTYWQEIYEENFCFIFPCYGISATLQPLKK